MDRPEERRVNILAGVMRVLALTTALLLPAISSSAAGPQSAPKVGEEYEIIKRYETSEQTSDGSSGSSRGGDAILERVIEVREDGLELEYDLLKSATAQERARAWQFPARISKPSNGVVQLLNRPELEERLEGWLKAAGWTRAACGRWIFTWNAFQIECDPQSVIKTIEAFDLGSGALTEGAAYHDAAALAPGRLARKAARPDGATFVVVLEVNPDPVRRASAESDVVVGEIMKEPVTLEAALRERAKESISGTITVTLETDATGSVRRRTKVTKLKSKAPDGPTESRTITETVERRLVLGPSGRH